MEKSLKQPLSVERYLLFWNILSEGERLILRELFYFEPDCAEFISRRRRLDLKEIQRGLKFLENLGIIKEVFTKENYIYYEIRPEWKSFLRKNYFEGSEDESGS